MMSAIPPVACVDLAPASSKHAMQRVHRSALEAFLSDRSNTLKFEAMRAQRRRKK